MPSINPSPGISKILPNTAPIHGGRLNAAIKKYNIPKQDWIDLSTGINPNGWPIPKIPTEFFQRLPEENDGLESAAKEYYNADNFISIPGSQFAIQKLPYLRKKSHVFILSPGYQEHAYCWEKAGHIVQSLTSDEIDTHIKNADVLVIINPNNPTGEQFSAAQLLAWHNILNKKGGWLIVDEAFIDGDESNSLIPYTAVNSGMIVLRSIGKFFGLAGIRVGFIFSSKSILPLIKNDIGPWPISSPSRYIATQALKDRGWQKTTNENLNKKSQHLKEQLKNNKLLTAGGCSLFQWVKHPNASQIFQYLAKQGVLVRYFKDSSSIRFGLPENDKAWKKLDIALNNLAYMKNE